MSKKLRYVSPHSLVDLSCRCIQGRFLLRPGELLNQLILGVLVLALRGTKIKVHSFCVMSNHWLCAAAHNQCYVEQLVMWSELLKGT